jgi:rfaE bifunctional protein kinase chain/domain
MILTENITKLFSGFRQLRIMIVGDVMIDSYLFGSVDRISSEAPVPIVAVRDRSDRLGGAANVALNICAMGAEPILCSVIGNTSKADSFMQLLDENNMSAKGILRSNERHTTVKYRIIGNNVQMIRVDEEHTHDLSLEEENLFLETIHSVLNQNTIDAIILQDYNKGVLTENVIQTVISIANDKNIPVAVDPKKKNFFAYKNATLFKPNLKELKEGLEIKSPLNTLEEIKQAVKLLQQKLNTEFVFATLSEKGVYLLHRLSNETFEDIHFQAHLRSIADVSGAGDTVISLAALCLAQNADIESIAALSNLAGGLVCEEIGVVPIKKEKLEKEAINLIQE